jgi:DNA-binding CsgD family transcriptional regulator
MAQERSPPPTVTSMPATGVYVSGLFAAYDAIVQTIYRAASGLETWDEPMRQIAAASAAINVGLMAFNREVGTVLFGYSGGPRPPNAIAEYIRTYHRIDPRLPVVLQSPIGKWVACQDHFDDEFVANHPFYRDFLLPYGARYLYAAKLLEDDATIMVMAHSRPQGNPMVDPAERTAVERIGRHVSVALEIQKKVRGIAERDALGFALLDRLNQPVILLDRDRNITFSSREARAMLERGDPLSDRDGVLICRNAECDAALTMALRELVTLPSDAHTLGNTREGRRTMLLRSADSSQAVAATLVALRARDAEPGALGHASRALLAIHQPGPVKAVDPDLLIVAFGFTRAEARMAARLAEGLSVDEIATEFGVSISTIRSQLSSAFEKTSTKRQAELVRVLLAVNAF